MDGAPRVRQRTFLPNWSWHDKPNGQHRYDRNLRWPDERVKRRAFFMLSHELLTTAVETVCYFCTAVGVVLSCLLMMRG
jgi:hypothetical protein